MKKRGIYKIENTITGKFYIGSTSVEFKGRKAQHVSQLRAGTHHSTYLQNSWSKYGEKAFKFELIEMVSHQWSKEQIFDLEQAYITTLAPAFNMTMVVKYTSRVKAIDACKFRIDCSEELKKKISIRVKANYDNGFIHPMLGLTHNEQSKEQMASKKQGNSIRKDNPTYTNILQIDITTNKIIAEHNQAADAAESLGLARKPNGSKIVRACRETHRTAFGYKWRFKSNALVKSGELMETPEEDNHEPS